MSSKNSKTSDPHRLLLNLIDKLDLRKKDKYIALSNHMIWYIWRNIEKSYENNKLKISDPIWNEEFQLPDGSYSISDIQDYFEYILKKHGEMTINPSIRIYTSKIENVITFKIKTGYYLWLLTPETMKLLWNNKSKIIKIKNRENVTYLETTEVISLMLSIIVTNKIQESCIHLFLINRLVNY